MPSKRDTGEGTEYTDADEGELEAALDHAMDDYDPDDYDDPDDQADDDQAGPEEPNEADMSGDDEGHAGGGGGGGGGGEPRNPTSIRVTARIEWAGVEQEARGGIRTTRLQNLNLGRVREAVEQTRQARARVEAAPAGTSFRAVGWQARLRELTGHRAGSEMADRVGLNPSERTVVKWLSGEGTPSKTNLDRIDRAYEALRTRHKEAARAEAASARHKLAEEFSAALKEEYGANIRIRDIRSIKFED